MTSSNPVTTAYLDRPAGRIGYDVTGEGPLVVCVPGMGDLRATYRFLVPALVAAGYRVATMDLRGHGDSSATFDAYDDVAAGTDVLALVAHLGGPAVVVGNSMGAGAATWAAAEQPDAVSALVLLGPFVREVPVPVLLRLTFRVALAGPWRTAVWGAYLPKLFPGRAPADFAEHRAAVLASMRRPGYGAAFAATSRTSHAPVGARLEEVTAPTLVLMGERDPDFVDPAAEATLIAKQLRGRATVVPDAGHYPQAEFPERVNPMVLDFLAEATKRA